MPQLEIVQLTQEQYDTCKSEGQVTVGNKTIFFNPNTLYCIPTDYVAPTSATLFEFQDNKITKYTGPEQDIILPKTYSKSVETINRLGAPFKEEQFMMVKDIIRDFSSVQFCKADGTGVVTYTDYETFYTEFDSIFPTYDDCLLMNVTFEMSFNAQMLPEILANPIYVNGNIFESDSDWGNEDFSNWIMQQIEQDPNSPISLSFTGEYELTTFFEGTDYTVDTVGMGDGSSVVDTGFGYTVTIPDGFKTISQSAFSGCRYVKIVMPDSIETIESDAFYNCTQAFSGDVVLPQSLVSIGNGAFYGCTMNTLTIGKNCTNISISFGEHLSSTSNPRNPFWIKELTEFIVDSENPNYTAVDGVLYDKNIATLIAMPKNVNISVYNMPNTVTKCADVSTYGVTALQQVNIGENVEILGSRSFSSGFTSSDGISNIQVVNFLGTKLIQISDDSFSSLDNLTQLTLPNGLQIIGENCFRYSGITSITIPASITTVGGSMTQLKLNSLNYLGTVDDWISADGLGQFMSSNTVLTFNGQSAPTTITVTKNIGDYTFKYWKLTSVTIQDGVTSIGEGAFGSCSELTEVTIPNSVTSIGLSAFANTSLVNITLPEGIVTMENLAFGNIDTLQHIQYNCVNCNSNSNSTVFSGSGESLTVDIGSNVIRIPGNIFNNNRIVQVNFSENSTITDIGASAFSGCRMTTVSIPSSVQKIEQWAFRSCSQMTSVYFYNDISSDLDSIGAGAFKWGNSSVIYYVKDQASLTNIQAMYEDRSDKFTTNNFQIGTYNGG